MRRSPTHYVPVLLSISITLKSWREGQRRFGFSLDRNELDDAVARVAEAPHLQFGGLHNHLGANIRDLDRFETLSSCLEGLARGYGAPLDWIDVGGGLAGTNARPEEPLRRHSWIHPQQYCKAVLTPLVGAARSLILEPGRSPAYILDGGINSVSSALSRKLPIRALIDGCRPLRSASLYGPLCMNKDKLAENISLPVLRRGDLVLVEGVGAYDVSRGFAFIQPRPGVLLWTGATDARWLRRPESMEHIQRLENDFKAKAD
jgi:diaminopimelate decarboxylase